MTNCNPEIVSGSRGLQEAIRKQLAHGAWLALPAQTLAVHHRNTAFVCLSQDGFALGISSQAPFSHCIAWVVWRLVWVSSTVGSKIGSFKLVYRAKVEMRRADMRIRQARKFQSQGLGWTQHQFYCSYGVCQSAKLYFPPTQLGIFDSCNSFALHKQLSFMKDLISVFMCFPVLVCEKVLASLSLLPQFLRNVFGQHIFPHLCCFMFQSPEAALSQLPIRRRGTCAHPSHY